MTMASLCNVTPSYIMLKNGHTLKNLAVRTPHDLETKFGPFSIHQYTDFGDIEFGA